MYLNLDARDQKELAKLQKKKKKKVGWVNLNLVKSYTLGLHL